MEQGANATSSLFGCCSFAARGRGTTDSSHVSGSGRHGTGGAMSREAAALVGGGVPQTVWPQGRCRSAVELLCPTRIRPTSPVGALVGASFKAQPAVPTVTPSKMASDARTALLSDVFKVTSTPASPSVQAPQLFALSMAPLVLSSLALPATEQCSAPAAFLSVDGHDVRARPSSGLLKHPRPTSSGRLLRGLPSVVQGRAAGSCDGLGGATFGSDVGGTRIACGPNSRSRRTTEEARLTSGSITRTSSGGECLSGGDGRLEELMYRCRIGGDHLPRGTSSSSVSLPSSVVPPGFALRMPSPCGRQTSEGKWSGRGSLDRVPDSFGALASEIPAAAASLPCTLR